MAFDGLSVQEARHLCWLAGQLWWKLKPHQRIMYDGFKGTDHRKYVYLCSRRLGKSFTLLCLALETALQKPGAQIRYAAATQRNVKEIILPIMRLILLDCPPEIAPRFHSQDSKYVFPNGSEISLAGTDGGNADRLRGPSCDLGILDEAAFMDDLTYVIRSIIMPQFLTTDGRLLLASTPPKTPGHEFTWHYGESLAKDAAIKLTIYQDSRPEVLARIPEWMAESGGAESTDWKREYLCEFVTDQTLAIIPEMTEAKTAAIVRAVPRPAYFDAYVGMDVGFVDLTAVVFGYWDFLEATVVVEDELVLSKMTTEQLADGIKTVETRNWGADFKPFLRVSDVEPILINDLSQLHGLHFSQTAKDDKESAVNGLRLLVAQGKVIIHPRCKNLIAHLKFGVWNKAKSKFERVEGFGHFDFIDALVYLVRNVRREKNPWPLAHGLSPMNHFIPPEMVRPRQGSAAATLERMIPRRKNGRGT